MSEPSLVQPYPPLPIGDGFDYSISFTVIGSTELDAIDAAVRLLRTDLKLRGVNEAQRVLGGFWRVSLNVHEEG